MSVQLSELTNRRFEELSNSAAYETLKRHVESHVVKWRWATWEKFGLEPYDSEKNRFPKGRWLDSEPAVIHDKWLHGIDNEGRIAVIRGMCELPGMFSEEFFLYAQSSIERAYFNKAGRPLGVYSNLQLIDGVPARLESRSSQCLTAATYTYVDERLTTEHRVSERLSYGPRNLEVEYQYHYDARGRLELIECTEQSSPPDTPAKTYVVFRRPQKGESQKQLASQIEKLAIKEIVATIATAGLHDKIYNLLLVYDAENLPLPPMLALGPESLRQRAKSEHGKNAKFELWNPADYPHFNVPELELKNPELLEACALLNQQMAERDNFRPARRLLNSVAAQLQQRDWTGILQATDDFVVAAVDLESQDDLQKNIKKSAPSELIKKLKREGLL